jgi:muconolactone delta-isomerase
MMFMVESTQTQPHTEQTLALIPAEMARGKELDAQGLRRGLFVAADFSKAWQVYDVDSERTLRALLQSLPLYEIADHTITPLADGSL